MISSSNFTAVLDACVLYPSSIRDLLLSLADANLFKPKWSDEIQQEWKRNLLRQRPDLTSAQLDRTIHQMNLAFQDANISGHQILIPSLNLPDLNDRHVLAAAICGHADVIVTFNLSDFPAPYLKTLSLEAQHPDEFISNIISLYQEASKKAFLQQVQRLRNPQLSPAQVLAIFERNGLKNTTKKLRALLASRD